MKPEQTSKLPNAVRVGLPKIPSGLCKTHEARPDCQFAAPGCPAISVSDHYAGMISKMKRSD
jgi:hypothetical protein